MKKFISIIHFILLIGISPVICQNLYSGNPLSFPFIERFTEGSLETNGWSTDCENWVIETAEGIPAPCVQFNGYPLYEHEYNCMLSSDWIMKDTFGVFLKFDFKVQLYDYNENDTLIIEVYDSTTWITAHSLLVYEFNDYWHDEKFELTEHIKSTQFKVRFRASGNNTSNIEYIGLDNIFVFDGVEFPNELTGEYYWDNEFGVKLHWTLDRAPGAGGWGSPLSYSYEFNCNELGLTSGGDWAYAVKWDSVGGYNDSTHLYVVQAYIGDTDFDKITLNIWKGQYGITKVFSRNVTNEIERDQWNTFRFIPTQLLKDTAATWIGFEIFGQEADTYPAGMSCNESVYGYGNLIKNPINSPWDTLPSSIDHNWSIVCLIQSRPSFYDLDGYIVNRRVGQDTVYDFLAYADNDFDEGEYYDKYPNVDIQTSYTYQVMASWTNPWIIPADTLFSIAGYALINGDNNFVTVLVTDEEEHSFNGKQVSVYPNPFTHLTTIEYTLNSTQTVTITFYDSYGRTVDQIAEHQQHGLQKVVWTPKRLNEGIYYFKLAAERTFHSGKVILVK